LLIKLIYLFSKNRHLSINRHQGIHVAVAQAQAAVWGCT